MSARRRQPRREPGRVRAAVVLAAGAGALLAAQVAIGTPGMATPPPLDAAAVPPASATSSAWVCGGFASGITSSVILTSSTDHPVRGVLKFVSAVHATGEVPFTVPADGVVALAPNRHLHDGFVATVVTLFGGGVAASTAFDDQGSTGAAPCQSATAARWDFAYGATSRNIDTYLTLTNPTPAVAVASTTFSTPSGLLQPAAFQGIVVPPQRSVTLDLGRHVQGQGLFATEVLATSGRLVASELVVLGGRHHGVAALAGQAGPLPAVVVANSTQRPGAPSLFSVANPSVRAEKVAVRIELASGPLPTTTITLPPHAVALLGPGSFPAVPANFAFAVSFSTTGPGVVVARVATAPVPGAIEVRAVGGAALVRQATTIVLPPAGIGSGGARYGTVGLWATGSSPVTVQPAVGGLHGASIVVPAGRLVELSVAQIPGLNNQRGLLLFASGPLQVMAGAGPSAVPGGQGVAGQAVQP